MIDDLYLSCTFESNYKS